MYNHLGQYTKYICYIIITSTSDCTKHIQKRLIYFSIAAVQVMQIMRLTKLDGDPVGLRCFRSFSLFRLLGLYFFFCLKENMTLYVLARKKQCLLTNYSIYWHNDKLELNFLKTDTTWMPNNKHAIHWKEGKVAF